MRLHCMIFFHPCTCTDGRLLTVDFKRPKVIRINQACEVTESNQLYAKNSNKCLEKASPFLRFSET